MTSLGTRLFAAFVFIILLVITIVSLTLIVLLRNNPLVERQTIGRLHTVLEAVFRERFVPPPRTEAELNAAVREIAAANEVRVLLATTAGAVIADSAAPDAPPIDALRLRQARRDSAFPNSLIGSARDRQQRLWLYVARPAGAAHIVVIAAPLQRLAVLVFFRENLARPLLEAAAVAALVAAALAVLISRGIALPLQKMAGVAQGIARGHYDQAAPETGPVEVRALGEALNRMAQQIQATQAGQRDFLANVSHELKTPLTSIQGFAQAMLDGAVDSPEGVQRSANIIYAEADRMRGLVDGLLDLARLDAGLRTLSRASLDLRALLAGTVDRMGLRAREKGLTLRAELPPVLPSMAGDADRLAQVFTNLLDNAIKYTPQGGTVTLTAAEAPGGVEVAVADTGSGIPPEDLSRIFERFYQVDKSRARSGGLGLGLAITKEIVDAHGGRLRVESQVGQGSRFTVWLPAVRPDASTVVRRR
jgi:two-component system OmpR family sensor kinase